MSENNLSIIDCGSSPFTYTNNSNSAEIVVVHGASTVNIIEFNGIEIFNTAFATQYFGGQYYLAVGDKITIYYAQTGNIIESPRVGAPSMYRCSIRVFQFLFCSNNPT